MSLYSKIRIIFIIALLFVTAFFSAYFYIEHSHRMQEKEKRYMQTSLFLHKHFRESMRQEKDLTLNFLDDTMKLYLDESDFSLLTEVAQIQNIQKNAVLVHQRKFLRSEINILKEDDKFFLALVHPKFQLLLQDKQRMQMPWEIVSGYFFSLVFLLWLYVWLTTSLKPLKQLQQQIEKVGEGDLTISVKSDKKDEIAAVSNAFDDALRKLESLINSRQLFLRAIMHELKTPIGKGKILTAFLEKSSIKEGYDEVFERLELLLDEFSRIEQMLSSHYEVHLKAYNAKDLVDQALELMIMDEETLSEKVEVVEKELCVLETDFTLFPLALKNLIDNAIKYASDHQVMITITGEGIVVSNSGAQFTENLEAYFKPFHGKGNGLGLGLYIVQSIMEMLHLKLHYHYDNGKNIFTIAK